MLMVSFFQTTFRYILIQKLKSAKTEEWKTYLILKISTIFLIIIIAYSAPYFNKTHTVPAASRLV